MELLINHGSDPECGADNMLSSPLIEASHHGHLDIVKLLLSKGANVNRYCTTSYPGKYPVVNDFVRLRYGIPIVSVEICQCEHFHTFPYRPLSSQYRILTRCR